MRIVVTDREVISAPHQEQPILYVLQEKGAPVEGTIFLRPNLRDYVWHMEYNYGLMATVFEIVPAPN